MIGVPAERSKGAQMSAFFLSNMLAQNMNKRRDWLKQLTRVRGEIYDYYLKVYYHMDETPEIRAMVSNELQKRGVSTEMSELHPERLTSRILTKPEALTIPGVFVLDPANYAFLDGTATRTKSKPSSIGYAVVMLLLIAAFFGFFAVRDFVTVGQIEQFGTPTQAEVIKLEIVSRRNPNGTSYYATYRFVDATGQEHSKMLEIDSNLYYTLKIPSQVEILYLPNDPSVSRIRSASKSFLNGEILGTVLFVLLAIMAFAISRSERRTEKELADSGQLFQAHIVETAGLKQKGGHQVNVAYVCKLPDGSVVWGDESAIREDLKQQPRPPAGTPVILEYANAKNYRLL
jgi:hypothetical protein